MGFLDKIKKAVSGGSAPAPKTGGQGSGGQGGNRQGGQGSGGNRQGGQGSGGQGGNRQGGNRNRGGQGQGGQGGNRQGSQGGNRQGGNRPAGDSQAQGEGGNRRRGSRGGRNRSGGQGSEQQGGQATQDRPEQGDGGQQGGQGAAGSNASKRRRRGGRGRGSGSTGSGGTRTVTRSDAAELKEQQEKSGDKPQRDRGGRDGGQGGQRKRSRGGRSGGSSGGSGSGGGNRRGGRERTRRGSSSSGSQRRVLDANERPKDPVKKQILINAQDPNEIRVAIREQQQVVEVYVERKGKRSLAGNIYKGRVQNVLPGMEACFVDVGLERNGFLYVDEITPAAADSDQIMKVSMVTEVEAGAAESTDPATQAMEAAAAEHDETLEISDAMEEEDREQAEAAASAEPGAEGDKPGAAKAKGRGRSRIQNKKKIQELLKQGQEILVQVVKDPMGTKGSRLTTQYSLAGRYLVYVPDGEGLGVSRRLEDAERNRLREIVKQFELPWGGGLIVRTAAEGARDEDIAKDLDLLLRLHEQLMEKAGDARAPKLLYNEADLSLRIIRDLFNGEVEEVLVDDDRQYQRITNYLKRTSPELAERVRMHDGQRPLFESYGVEDAIKSTLSKRAELPSGGYLIIDKTEAFHVIDVNSGRNVGKASLEETITKTNMEAAAEVVRQLRLRDLGGIIVIDFIDMNLMKNRDAVLEHFRTELSKDRTKTYLVEISPLGLVEMTRQNVSEGVREILTSTCRTCEGRGVQVSPETHAIEVERALVDLAAGLGDVEAVAIDAQPDVAKALAGNQGKQVELDKRTGKHVRVLPDPDLSPNTFAVRATGTIAEVDAAPEPLVRGSKHKVMIDRVDPVCEDDGIATIDGVLVTVIGAGSAVGEERTVAIAACSGSRAFATLVKPARRRRRRGGRGRRKATVGVGADGATTLLDEDGEELDGEDTGEDELDGADEDEFEDFEEDEAAAVTLDDAPEEFDDERTEIPQRLVMLDEDDDAEEDGDDEGDDEQDHSDEDDDAEGDEDEDDDEGRGDSDDSDSGSDGGDDGDDDDDDPSGGAAEEADASDDSDDASEDDLLDPTSISDGNGDDDARTLVRRDAEHADRDEPSIDVDGPDELLEQRGITSEPRRATPQARAASTERTGGADADASDGDADSSSGDSASGERGPDGAPRRRRRRGSRGGRGRSRSGSGQPRAEGGDRPQGGSTGQSSGDGAASSARGGSGSDGSSDA